MGKKILDSRFLYIVLSILIAVGLWLFVTINDETPESRSITRIPVTFTGEDILAGRDLMLVGGPYTASVTVQATPTVLAAFTNKTVQVTANVSGIAEEGTHTVSYTVIQPSGISPSQFTVVSGVNGNVIDVEVARFNRREVEIRGEFTGNAAEGYLAGEADDFRFYPEKIWVSGPLEAVNQVSYALVTVPGKDLTETVDGDFSFQLYDPSDNPLTDLNVTCDVQTVHAIFPIQATAEIPLSVSLTDGGGVSAEQATVELSTTSIAVAGTTEAVEAIVTAGTINLGTIDLAAVSDGEELTFPVPLADELTNLTGVAEVKATVRFNKRVIEKSFDVTNIYTINAPAGWTAAPVTQVLPVTVRGNAALVNALTADSFRVVADLKDVTPTAGPYTASVYVYLDSAPSTAELGVLAGDYRVILNFTEGESGPSASPEAGE